MCESLFILRESHLDITQKMTKGSPEPSQILCVSTDGHVTAGSLSNYLPSIPFRGLYNDLNVAAGLLNKQSKLLIRFEEASIKIEILLPSIYSLQGC